MKKNELNENIKRIFIERLNNAIQEKGWTNRQLAKASGLTDQQINHYRTGYCLPKTNNVFKLAAALGVSPSWLGGIDEELSEIMDRLSPADHNLVIAFARRLAEQNQEE